MPVTHSLIVPSLAVDTVERTAAECAVVWRRFQEGMPAFATLPDADISAIESFVRAEKGKWENIIILGIGGSSLGADAVIAAVGNRTRPHVRFITLDNVDPLALTALLSGSEKINLKRSLIIVTSKSGTTLETMASFFILREKLGKNWQRHVVVITDPTDGFLRDYATEHGLRTFDFPPAVGGRFSVLSPSGLVPAALAGVSIRDLLAGAREVQAVEAFHFALVAAELFTQQRNITVFCPYAQHLRKLGDWYAQLLAESVGKHASVGITPEVSIGVTDQHSKLQLWSDGPDDKFFMFFAIEKFARDAIVPPDVPPAFAHIAGKSLAELMAAEFTGTVTALRERNRPMATFSLPDLSSRSVGYLLQFFMLEVAFLGEILGVNPYDQPGVERGKVIAKELLTNPPLESAND